MSAGPVEALRDFAKDASEKASDAEYRLAMAHTVQLIDEWLMRRPPSRCLHYIKVSEECEECENAIIEYEDG